MPAKSAEEFHSVFSDIFASNDIEALISLYEPNATLMAQPDRIARGHAEIRLALNEFLKQNPRLTLRKKRVFESEDVALLISDWVLTGVSSDGNTVQLMGRTSDVIRRQEDGTWLFVINNPFTNE